MANDKRPPVPQGEFTVEEITGVGSTPIENIERRTKNAARDASKTLDELAGLRTDLRTSVARDVSEHKRLSDGLVALTAQQATTHKRLDDLAGDLREFRVSGGQALDILVEDARANRLAAQERARVALETEAMRARAAITSEAEDRKASRDLTEANTKARNERWFKIVTIIGSTVGTGGILFIVVAALVRRC